MNCLAVRNVTLVGLILLVSGGAAQARKFGGVPIKTSAEELKRYEDDVSDLEDFFDIFPAENLSIRLTKKRFSITQLVLERLEEEGVAADIRQKLRTIKNQEVVGEEAFVELLHTTLAEDEIATYASLLLTLAPSGKYLIIGPSIDSTSEYRKNFELNASANGATPANGHAFLLDQELGLDLIFSLSKNLLILLQAKLFYEALLQSPDHQTDVVWDVERGETWVYFRQLFGSDFSVQVGRQNFLDKRTWWWDAALDAVRLHYNGRFDAQLAVGGTVASLSPRRGRIDPAAEGVIRLLGRISWEWTEGQWLAGFFLYQHDASGGHVLAEFVSEALRDDIDAHLTWFGLRALGSIQYAGTARFDYWLDLAGVVGHETQFSFDDEGVVEALQKHDVTGWAVDVGVTWQTNLPWHPALTVGYAVGSGDRQPASGTDCAFRQTGIQGNDDFFGGNFRFHYQKSA